MADVSGSGPRKDPPPSGTGRKVTVRARAQRRIESARRHLEGSRVQGTITRLQALDVADWTTRFGADLLWSVLPLLILLSSLANDRIDDDLSRHIGLDREGAHIVRGLFRGSPSHDGVAIAIGLLVTLTGSIALARSLQEMYEQIFGHDHRGWRDLGRHLAWVGALVVALVAQATLVGTVHGAGPAVLVLVRCIAGTLFFWFTVHFLLSGRVPWRRLFRTALVTAALWLALGGFSTLYFSSLLVSDSREYGTIGVVFTFLTWFILIGAVLVLGAVAGSAWQARAETRPRRGRRVAE
jgi:membrane protein